MSFAVMMAAATVASAAATYSQGQAQEAAYEANADAARQTAVAQRAKATHEAGMVRDQGQSVLSTQRARYGASGVAMSGSALDVALETARKNEMDALTVKYNGEVAARQNESQANIYDSMGANAGKAGTIGAIGTLLTGAAQMSGATAGMMAPASTGAPVAGSAVPTMEMMSQTSKMANYTPGWNYAWQIPGWNR